MDLSIGEFGTTFLVGAFTILAVEAITYFVAGRHLTRISESTLGLVSGEGAPGTVTTGLFIGLSFALGLLVEDGCYKFHDPFLYRPFMAVWTMVHPFSSRPSPGEMKADIERSVLFASLDSPPALTSLGRDVCRAGLFALATPDGGKEVDQWACHGGALPQRALGKSGYAAVDAVVRATFFLSKNRVYREANYFGELRRIQNRLEFSRTIATLTFGGSLLTLLVAAVRLTRCRRDERRGCARRASLLFAAFVAVYVLASFAYLQESEEYDKRVFGYYAAMVWAGARALP